MSNCTVLTNRSGGSLEVKEGTAGVWRKLKTLENNEVYKIYVDPNATYREYWCAVKDSGPGQLYLSSDDCQECESVIVQLRANGTYRLEKKPRKNTGNVVPKAKDAKTEDGFVAKVKTFMSRFHTGSTSTKSTGNQKVVFLGDL